MYIAGRFNRLFHLLIASAVDGSLQEIERHLEMGKQYLSKGQFSDAIMHYDAALELDPDNYMTLYRRATAYLANGRAKSAIPDLNRVVELKPDFVAARLQRGNILLKQGDLDAAEKDFQTIIGLATMLKKTSIIVPQKVYLTVSLRYRLEIFVIAMPWSARLRLKRAECYERLGVLQKAISDIRSATRLVPDNTKALYKASQFSYMLVFFSTLRGIRECLKIDPDQRECFTFYKKLKRLVKVHDSMLDATENEQWKLCLDGAGQMLKQESEVRNVIMLVGQLDEAIRVCSEVLENDPNEFPALLSRAEAYIQNNEFEKGTKLSLDKVGIIKLLGKITTKFSENADKATIIKAYRKLAQKWHPDNYDKDEKKKAEARFIDIAAAKEVLTDPDKRAQYDSGVDPLDPEAQQQAHHPFYQYFQGFDAPFDQGGGPFTFKFHFQ
ncbi:DnaJ protein subfamily C [Trichuris trichiura]|uniref:DnaJ protein subfamily C n=1 Tax=Trichuris trichiura TaxID=36087 RepID=A0A077Z222_TRITR|nr:DnaJ protein subfamily C [Trichuris trichiura]